VVRAEAARQAERGLSLRLMFEDEARFGRMVDPRRAWAPPGVRPLVATRIEREYGYAYAAMSPHDGALISLVLPEVNTALMNLFLAEVSGRCREEFIFLVLDRAGWHVGGDLMVPVNLRLYPLPARSPELNPTEHLWEEWREKWLGNRLFDSQDAVDQQIERGLAALEKDPERVASLAGFHWITRIPLMTT
jgi:transposase